MSGVYLFIIVSLLIIEYLLNTISDFLNIKNLSKEIPEEFIGVYNLERYKNSQNYLKENTFFEIFKDTFFLILILIFIFIGGFSFLDNFTRKITDLILLRGFIFTGIVFFIFQLLNIPFLFYHTFVIEEKYGFNRTTIKTFILDIIKVWILSIIIGGIILTVLIWFFKKFKNIVWLYCFIFVALFEIFIMFVAPILILPLFNKFIPLDDEELKDMIQNYAKKQRFPIKNIFKIDASRRSTKTNAFFIGFGRFRRIGLFDTLIKNHTKEEILTVLAHEIGHYKKKHFLKGLVISILEKALLFFIFSLIVDNRDFFLAFKIKEPSLYSSFVLFSFIYNPISFFLSIFYNNLSRRYEYEADLFAVKTTDMPNVFICALKKLSVNNFSNLTPHRLKVLISYTHPPILDRINLIKNLPI